MKAKKADKKSSNNVAKKEVKPTLKKAKKGLA